MINSEEIISILEELIVEDDFYVVDVKVSKSKISRKVTALIDTDEGIGLDSCSRISRALADRLEDLIEDAYRLEVSSPGIDSPLKLSRQYKKNVGKELKITLLDGEVLRGTLLNNNDTKIELKPNKKKKEKVEPEVIKVSLSDIKEARVQFSFK